MLSCRITELKNFMSRLLTTDCFDTFLLEKAVITTYNTFTIDGHTERDFFTAEEWEDPSVHAYDLSRWADMRPVCYSLIKGKKTPVRIKFILQLKPEIMERLIVQSGAAVPANYVKAFVLTIRYENGNMTCITGVSLFDFLPDKTPERIWDEAFRTFLLKQDISCEM